MFSVPPKLPSAYFMTISFKEICSNRVFQTSISFSPIFAFPTVKGGKSLDAEFACSSYPS